MRVCTTYSTGEAKYRSHIHQLTFFTDGFQKKSPPERSVPETEQRYEMHREKQRKGSTV